MKKIYFFAAALAAAAAISSCSESEVAEQITEPVDEGAAFGITATIDGEGATRGGGTNDSCEVNTSKLQEKGFRMTGLKTGTNTDGGAFFDGSDANKTPMNTIPITYTSGKWTTGIEYQWATGSNPQAYDFYAVGNNTGKRSPFVSPMAQTGNNTAETPVDNEDGKISFPQFEYNLPSNAKNQEDLIVASKLGVSSGKVGLNFKHALTKINVKAVYRESFIKKNTDVDSYESIETHFFIKKIIFHGLANKAKFTFSGDEASVGSWSNFTHDDDQPIVLDFMKNASDKPAWVKSCDPGTGKGDVDAPGNWDDDKMSAVDDNGTDGIVYLGTIYAIPEPAYDSDHASTTMIPTWNYVPESPVVSTTNLEDAVALQLASTDNNSIKDHAYAEIECCWASTSDGNTTVTSISDIDTAGEDIQCEYQVGEDTDPMYLYCWGSNGDDSNGSVGWGRVYLPLKLAEIGLPYNGEVNLILNLHRSAVIAESAAGSGSWFFKSSFKGAGAGTE